MSWQKRNSGIPPFNDPAIVSRALILWNEGIQQKAICQSLHIGVTTLQKIRKLHNFPDRESARRNYRETNPTPMEIEVACRKIREGWAKGERINRRKAMAIVDAKR